MSSVKELYRLVEKDDFRIPNEGNGDAESSLHPATVTP